jgi:hypothetical protein
VGEGGERGGAGADDGGVFPGELFADGGVGEVGDAVGDAAFGGEGAFAGRGVAVGAEGVGGGVGAGGVDDGAGGDPFLAAVGEGEVDGEGPAVAAGPGDAGDGRAVADAVTQGVGQRLEVALGPLGARRLGGVVRAGPAGRGEELLRGGVDQLPPGG